MSATEATAEIFVTAFKALKRKEREAVLQKLVTDAELADDLADSLALEARRNQPRTPLREVLKDLRVSWRVDIGRDAKKELARLPSAVKKRIARALLALETDPFPARLQEAQESRRLARASGRLSNPLSRR